MRIKRNWVARIYSEKNDEVIDAWWVADMTEEGARDEIEESVARLYPGRDWTLHLAEEMEGGRFSVKIAGTVWVRVHTEGLHDVLHSSISYTIEQELDLTALEKAVRDAVYEHLAERGVTDAEVEVFEEYLDARGREMIEIEIYAR